MPVKINTADKEDIILQLIYQKKTIREMCRVIGKNIGTVQQVMAALEEKGFVENEARKKAGRKPTQKGILRLKEKNLL